MAPSETASLIEPLLEPLLEERGFLTFLLGFGIAMFSAVASGAVYATTVICTTPILQAMFGGTFVGAGGCITAASIAAISAGMAGGLGAYGAERGWTFEGVGAKEGKRAVHAPLIDNLMGVSHHYDADTHWSLSQTYGDMLDHHNTSIISVTWLEKLPTANHTGGPLEGLNMTNGRLITLLDSDIVRSAVGHTNMMGQILESFNEFKGTNYSTLPLAKEKRSTRNVDWVSFNTYGENMNEANGYSNNIYDASFVESANALAGQNDDFWGTQESGKGWPSKICAGLSPNGQAVGKESMIVGEIYMNQWGGIDSNCDGA
ncbi:hypothetical protein D0Z07_6100 [Hyphodiscus hymeniophilus]|uniref:Uncharacterized protein n=1 Tax=Hyphodiscus hymeniophilus TaxID=353542 RepID=A0A9P6VFC7_9HELO|nr:hypothetical protein D0Z07_6100 [Hyphodiscus hymeniophilus]